MVIRDVITSGMGDTYDMKTMHKVMMLNMISLTGVFFMVPLGIVGYVQENSALGLFDHFTALTLLLNLLYLRKTEDYQSACVFGIAMAGILFFFLLATGGVSNTAYLWYYTFPLFASFLLGSKKGAVATAILLLFAVIFFALDYDSPYLTHYSKDLIIRFIPSFIIVFIYSYAFEYFREQAEEKLIFKNIELNKTIIDLNEIETSLRKTQEELEKRVRERTVELSKANMDLTNEIKIRERAEMERHRLETQLAHSQKMEALGTLAGGIAHDFNNILAGIFGYSQLAEMHITEPEKVKNYINKMSKGTQRASDLVRQILTFSRHVESETIPLSVFFLVKEALTLLHSTIPSTIEIKKNILSKAMVMADPTQTHQVIMNLCTNAYHAMGESGGILTVGLNEVEVSELESNIETNRVPGKYLKLEVSDTGHGMDRETMGKIFDPYFTTKELGKGTGLGLAVVDGIVKKNRGFIKTSSVIGSGSTFQVFWPILEYQDSHDPLEEEQSSLFMGSEQIMLVDDETDILDTLQAILGRQGYKIKPFEDGLSALKAFEEGPDQFDLIITDMTMPRMTGDVLSKKILQIRKDMPIILCTGYHENFTKETAAGIGICKYVHKPVMARELSALIREILDQKITPRI